MLDKKQFFIGSLLAYINIFLSTCSGLVITPLLIRALGQNEYGLYNMIVSFTGYLSVLNIGFGATVVRYVAKYNAEDDEEGRENFQAICFLINAIIFIIILIVSIVLYFNINNIFKSLTFSQVISAKRIFTLFVLQILINILCTIFTSSLAGFGEFIFTKTLYVAVNLLQTVLTIVVIVYFPSAVALAAVVSSMLILAIMINTMYSIKKLKFRLKIHNFDRVFIKEIFLFSSLILLQSITEQIFWQINNMIIGIKLNTSIVAVNAVAYHINSIVLTFSISIATMTLPKVTHIITQGADNETITDYMIGIGRIIAMIYLLILGGFWLFGKTFVIYWAGEQYTLSYYIALILIITSAIPRIQSIANDILKAKNMLGFITIVNFIVAVVNVVLTLIFIDLFGVIGASIATAFSLIVGNIVISNIYYKKKVGLNISRFFKDCFHGTIQTLAISIPIGLLLRKIPCHNMLQVVVVCMIYAISYCVILYIVGLKDTERTYISQLKKHFLHKIL